MKILTPNLVFRQNEQLVQLIQMHNNTSAIHFVSVIQVIVKFHSVHGQDGMGFSLLSGHSYDF